MSGVPCMLIGSWVGVHTDHSGCLAVRAYTSLSTLERKVRFLTGLKFGLINSKPSFFRSGLTTHSLPFSDELAFTKGDVDNLSYKMYDGWHQ